MIGYRHQNTVQTGQGTPPEPEHLLSSGATGLPRKQGLYDPQFEHESCGVAFVVNVKGKHSHEIVRLALTALIHY